MIGRIVRGAADRPRLYRLCACSVVAGATMATAACASHPAGRGVGQVREGLGAAISAPLYDLNLRRKSLADVLTWAQVRPYDMSGLERCDAIAEEVALLDEALGPDLDEPAAPETLSLSATPPPPRIIIQQP